MVEEQGRRQCDQQLHELDLFSVVRRTLPSYLMEVSKAVNCLPDLGSDGVYQD